MFHTHTLMSTHTLMYAGQLVVVQSDDSIRTDTSIPPDPMLHFTRGDTPTHPHTHHRTRTPLQTHSGMKGYAVRWELFYPGDPEVLHDALYMKGGAGEDSIYSYRCPRSASCIISLVPLRCRQMQAVTTTGCISFDHTFDVMKNFKGAALKTVLSITR